MPKSKDLWIFGGIIAVAVVGYYFLIRKPISYSPTVTVTPNPIAKGATGSIQVSHFSPNSVLTMVLTGGFTSTNTLGTTDSVGSFNSSWAVNPVTVPTTVYMTITDGLGKSGSQVVTVTA